MVRRIARTADGGFAAISPANSSAAVRSSSSPATRLLVQDSIYESFLDSVAALIARRTPGTSLGPLTTPGQYAKVLSYFDVAAEEGARLVTGGRAADRPGRYVKATVYADVRPEMRIFREEIFGPVLNVTPFSDEAEAVALANARPQGHRNALTFRDTPSAPQCRTPEGPALVTLPLRLRQALDIDGPHRQATGKADVNGVA
jgi:hypothetical protein